MKVIVCAIAKCEDLYIDEWVTYYIYGLGVDHVHVFDNSDENTLHDLPSRYPGRVSVYHMPGAVMQVPAYNTLKSKVDDTSDTWCAFVDLDEFIVLKRHETLHELLMNYSEHSGLVLNWLLFGDNGQTSYTDAPVTTRFTSRASTTNPHVKTIANLSKLLCMNVHDAVYTEGHSVDTDKKVVVGPFNFNGPSDVACIHHYFTKTKEEFLLKRGRGRADTHDIRDVGEFDRGNENEVSDFSAVHVYDKARRRHERM